MAQKKLARADGHGILHDIVLAPRHSAPLADLGGGFGPHSFVRESSVIGKVARSLSRENSLRVGGSAPSSTEQRVPNARGPPPTFWTVFRYIYATEGIAGLYRGWGITVLRAAPANAAVFFAYEMCMKFLGAWHFPLPLFFLSFLPSFFLSFFLSFCFPSFRLFLYFDGK